MREVRVDPANNRAGTRLLGALLVRLAQREHMQRMLEDLEDLPREELLEELMAEFEKIVGRRHLEQLVELELARDRMPAEGLTSVPVLPPAPIELVPAPPASVRPAPQSPGLDVTPVMNPPSPPRDLPVPPPNEPVVPVQLMKTPKQEPHGRHEKPKKAAPKAESVKERQRVQPKEEPSAMELHHPRTAYDLREEAVYYLHGYMLLPPGESPAEKPFMLEEKGIEGKEFAFAIDRGGMRFFASTLRTYAANVNRHGVLLLNKQESIRLRGIHASILNELRAHGTLMPFAFGTVQAGREEFLQKLDTHTWALRQAVEALMKTTWWDLSVYALDSRIAEFLTPEGMSGRRERDRGRESYTIGPASQKLDIKALEKILGKEKKLAEGIHEELAPIADRADVDQMVGFGSGTSDDWKLILKSSYELPPSRVQWFCRTLTELQYRHFIYELMLVFDGAREPFAFPAS